MVRVLLGLLCAHATAELQLEEGSLDTVRTTLESLLQDLETEMEGSTDAVHDAVNWCQLGLKQRKEADASTKLELKRMASELEESVAALSKASATVEQLKADSAAAKHTLSQTRDLAKRTREEQSAKGKAGRADGQLKQRLRGMGDVEEKKRQASSSLQGQMQIALLSHSQREAQVSESRHRLKDRQGTADAEQSFTESFAADCDKLTLPELNLESRRPEAKPLEKLVQLFQKEIAPPVTTSTTTLPPLDESAIEAAEEAADEFAKEDAAGPDFLQVDTKHITQTDVMALLTGSDMTSSQPRLVAAGPHRRPARRAQQAHRAHVPAATKQIGRLLQRVEGSAQASLKHQQWCQFEDRQNDMSLRSASGLVSQLTAEIDASEDVEARLGEFAAELQQRSGALGVVGSKLAALAGDAEGRLARSAKQRDLGQQILARAAKIVQAGSGLDNGAEGTFAQALKLIQKTQAGLNATGQVAATARIDVLDVKAAIAQQVEDLRQAQDRELANVLSMKDDRAVRRGGFEETKQAYESEVEAAKQYASRLAQECSGTVFEKQSGRQHSEIRALEDARAVLSGKKPVDAVAGPHDQGQRTLSPLERAAIRLGVAVN